MRLKKATTEQFVLTSAALTYGLVGGSLVYESLRPPVVEARDHCPSGVTTSYCVSGSGIVECCWEGEVANLIYCVCEEAQSECLDDCETAYTQCEGEHCSSEYVSCQNDCWADYNWCNDELWDYFDDECSSGGVEGYCEDYGYHSVWQCVS
jgi:hypothetical protein